MKSSALIENSNFAHKEHREWLNQLNFYQDEIKFFQNELALVLHKHLSSFSIIESTNEYKNIFLKKLQHIDELRHQIIVHEKKLSNSSDTEVTELTSHQVTRDKFLEFVADFELLKKNFKGFASHND